MKRTLLVQIAAGLLLCVIFPQNSVAADTVTILNSKSVTGEVETVSNIWKGDIPTKIGFPSGTFSQKLEFPIQGLLPYETLANRSTGVEVEFEIWSETGKKIASDTVYSFDWNPVGPNTLVSMYLSESEAAGRHTLLIRTIYELSTTGLLTRYLKSELKIPLEISIYSKPSTTNTMTASWGKEDITYRFSLSDKTKVQDYFEIGFQYLLNTTSDKTKYANYSQMIVFKKVTEDSFSLKYEEILNWAKANNLDVEKSTIMVRVRGINTWGVGEWGYGLYTDTVNFNRRYQDLLTEKLKSEAAAKVKAELEAKAKAAAELKAKVPIKVLGLSNTQNAFGLEFKFDTTNQTNTVDSFEIGLSRLVEPDADPSISSNYTFPSILRKITSDAFTLTKDDVRKYLNSIGANISKSNILVRVRAINAFGQGEWSSGIQIKTSTLFPGNSDSTTIKCFKGSKTKKVTAVNPKCPSGYKKK